MLTVVVQICGTGDQHEEEKGREAESHAKQLCVTEGGHVRGGFTFILTFASTTREVTRSLFRGGSHEEREAISLSISDNEKSKN